MKKFPLYIVSALLLSVVPVRMLGGELTGQIFIVTKGHESKKLGLVAVAVFDEKEAKDAIDSVRAKTLPDVARLQKLLPGLKNFSMAAWHSLDLIREEYVRGRSPLELYEASRELQQDAVQLRGNAQKYLTYLLSARRFFKELPQPIATTKTDADGNFVIQIPDDRDLVIGAAATRAVFGDTESYHWLVRVPKPPPSRIMLSNDNLASTGDSILAAGDEDGEDFGSVDAIVQRLNAIVKEGMDRLAKMKLTPAQRATMSKTLNQETKR